jgi:Domain of unknown function (DUF1707)
VSKRGSLRASDADREHIADRLRKAAAEGRILTEELEHRLAAAFSARTYGELDELTADLPRDAAPVRRRPQLPIPAPAAALAFLIFMPMVVAVIVAAVVLVVSMTAMWALVALVAMWMFGRRPGFPLRHYARGRYYGRGWHACGNRWRA